MPHPQPTNDQLLAITEFLRAVAHPIRIQVILLLDERGACSVKDIHEELDIQQPVASHHLRILKDKGVVNSQRAGQSTMYQLAKSEIAELVRLSLSI